VSHDGRRCSSVLRRNSYSRFNRLFAVSLEGGLPHETALPTAEFGAFPLTESTSRTSVTTRAACQRLAGNVIAAGRHRGYGFTNLADLSLEQRATDASNDGFPMWEAPKFTFFQIATGPSACLGYDVKTRKWSRRCR